MTAALAGLETCAPKATPGQARGRIADLNGPWLLFDNERDPYQTNNLANAAAQAALQEKMDQWLARKLKERRDEFRPAADYIAKWGDKVNARGTVVYDP
jgi:hypothetical protein